MPLPPRGLVLPVVAVACLAAMPLNLSAADYPVQPVPFSDVRITGGFWRPRQEINRTVTVPFALQQCEDSGRMRNFDLAAETMRRRAAGEATFQHRPPTIYPFDDTDAYKAIEAASYTLSVHPDAELEARLDGMIARIAAAQEPDGYLYTFRTMHPDAPGHKWIDPERWAADPELSHELYNLGHLYEAGVAHHQATGKRTLLDVCLKSAELLWRDFGAPQRRLAPGHQVIEIGLAKLYRVTGDKRYLQLAQLFLDARGPGGPEYNQRHLRVVDQTTAVGHAVRANYQYAGMADVAALHNQPAYVAALERIWGNVVARKLYLTGGVGARSEGEAYGADYELPPDGYNETCAAVALMMWAHRMFLLSGDAQYLDVLERTAFNGFLSGVDLGGDRFFYPNPLVYDGAKPNNHGHAGRAPWFGCACCPPNLTRTLAALTGYVYAVRGDELFVNFYAESEGEAQVAGTRVRLAQQTAYPWDGDIRVVVTPATPARFSVRLRRPGWSAGQPVPSDLYTYAGAADAGEIELHVNGEPVRARAGRDGYLVLTREWHRGDLVELSLPMPVRRVQGRAEVGATQGRVALERGPVVYCVEDTGGLGTAVTDLALPASAPVAAVARPEWLGGVTALELAETSAGRVTAIPYYAWNNRGLHPMAVWLRETR